MPHPNRDSARKIVACQYFLFFGVLGVFLPFFNLYCYHLGYSGLQIGAISASRSLGMVLFPLFWGAIADRYQIRRPIYIVCHLLSTAIFAFYIGTTSFIAVLIITCCYAVFFAPTISFLESFALEALGRNKNNYGKLRVWGSISFIITVLVLGAVLEIFPLKIILILIFAGSCLQALLAFKIPAVPSQIGRPFNIAATGLLNKKALIFFTCGFLMLVSHGPYYGFFSIHLEHLGFDKTFIGFAWALASISEIGVMIASAALLRRYKLENILAFSFGVAVLRWGVLIFAVTPGVILATQILHAATFGTFHMASILYMDRITPPEAKTLGQAANNAVTYGLGLMVGFFFGGLLFERVGSSGLFILSAAAALAGGSLLITCKGVLEDRPK